MRKASGCIAVDMECSALAAFAKARGIKYAQFVYAADNLDAERMAAAGTDSKACISKSADTPACAGVCLPHVDRACKVQARHTGSGAQLHAHIQRPSGRSAMRNILTRKKDHEKLLCNIYISVSRQQGRFSSGSEASGRYYQERTGSCLRYDYFYPGGFGKHAVFVGTVGISPGPGRGAPKQPHFALIGKLKEKYSASSSVSVQECNQ